MLYPGVSLVSEYVEVVLCVVVASSLFAVPFFAACCRGR